MRPLRRSLGWLLLALLGACADQVPPNGESHGVLVIAVDGLRADHVGVLGGQRPSTPQLDALASEGLVFSDAIAAAPLLQPAHIGILTGSSPELARLFYSHESGAARWQIKPAIPHMAVEFLSAGYRTAAFIDESTLAPSEGFARGFQQYQVLDERLPSKERTAKHGRHLEDWLHSLGSSDSWFAYMQLSELDRSWTEPLQPWDTYFRASKQKAKQRVPAVGTTDGSFFAIPHSRWRGGSRTLGEYEASYAGHLRRLDQELGAIFARLRTLGIDQNTTLVVVGSHGTQFGEAGLYLSSGKLSLADLHVPWIMRPRAGLLGAPAGSQVSDVVSLLDLAPTLLEIEGLDKPAGMHGLSQAAHLAAQGPAQPVREAAYASNGLIDGYAMVGERFVLELERPTAIQNRIRRLSWNGEEYPESAKDAIRYYDRLEQPSPPLQLYVRKKGQAHRDFLARYDKAKFWANRVFHARGVLQRAGLWGKPVEPEMIAELLALGYLGPQE